MEKSRDASQEKSEEQLHDNGITKDQEEETCSKDGLILVGRPDDSNSERTSQPVEEDATRGTNGEGSCSLSSDEIKLIVANFLAAMSTENLKGPSDGKESAYNGVNKIAPDESSKHKSKFSRFSSGKRKKAYAMSKSKSSRSNSRKNKTLQSRGGSGVPEPIAGGEKSNPVAHESSSRQRRRKKNKKLRENASDVFTKLRNRVRYILNKIKYEQSLIDAYGGEGWKGMSIDKLKPEKELQRASSEILQCKLRLREMFQRLDAICAEGAYPKSMFDSEGLLDSEDIYCTICGSKEISTDNDIVLCDGECNRAFHQFCLKPPLLTEEIPPEDQGWLCPGCDCKFDCTELLNDFFGFDLSMKDNWTSIFPEAATAAACSNNLDEILRLPSDDSEDDDFNPENMEVDNMDKAGEGVESYEGEDSASDDSDFSSASEDLGDFINKGQLVEELPNNVEDEEEDDDDDYDPEVPDPHNMDVSKPVEVEKSADGVESSEGEGSASDESDFSSASEDLGDFINKGQLVEELPNNLEDDDEEEDDDYDPEAPDPDNMDVSEPVEIEKTADGVESSEEEGSSSDESDFSFAAEDLGDFACKQLVGKNPDNSEDENDDFDPEVREPDQENDIIAELDTITSPINETSEFVSAETEQDSHVRGSKKRDIERLDYKKLYDETYGNKSDSSDDEEWSEVGPSQKKLERIKRGGSTTLKRKKRGSADDDQPMDTETKPQKTVGGTAIRSSKKLKASSENGSMDKGSRVTLGETATQKLTEAFQKNHYPERAVKEGLAKDLGLSYQKVDKWFGNARWSFNHPLHVRSVSKSNLATNSPPQTNTEGKHGKGKELTAPNSHTTDIRIHGDSSNTPSKQVKKQSARLQESHTGNDDANKGNTDNTEERPEKAIKYGNKSARNTKRRGRKKSSLSANK